MNTPVVLVSKLDQNVHHLCRGILKSWADLSELNSRVASRIDAASSRKTSSGSSVHECRSTGINDSNLSSPTDVCLLDKVPVTGYPRNKHMENGLPCRMALQQKAQKKAPPRTSSDAKGVATAPQTTAVTPSAVCLSSSLLINNKIQELNASKEGSAIARRKVKPSQIHTRSSAGLVLKKLHNRCSSSENANDLPEAYYRKPPTTLPTRLPYFVECKVPHVPPQPPTFRFSTSSVLFQQIIRGEPCTFDISPSFHSERIVRSGVLADGFKKGLFNPRNFAFVY
ncbi:unnamed protein product [Schistocephalus solidus]|uniref:Uncharacterized protein n=1 Tax=Schistocephalus solidus TaxID=70667 RepID=A0A183SMY6_SCHSO|nr:unnamed protein product [Schistocephalus solidus]